MSAPEHRVLEEEEFFEFYCKWHCVKCGRHFYDEKAFKNHFDGFLDGCHKPEGTAKLAVYVAVDGICNQWSWFSNRPDWRHTPRRDVRVYWSERI